jgi:lambda family phage portal protein
LRNTNQDCETTRIHRTTLMNNIIDQIISFVSPEAGLKRARNRAAMNAVRSFDAASRGRRTSGWVANGTSANAETRPALHTLRDRAREQIRNNSYAKKAVNVIANNVVGAGIRLSINDKQPERETVLQLWRNWAESTICDYDGRLNFYGLQNLIISTVATSGECLIVKKKVKFKDGIAPIQVQVLEADFIDTNKEMPELSNGGKIFQGVEFDKAGKRVAYWLFKQHPGDPDALNTLSYRVSADLIQHVFSKDRPGQERGVPFGVSSMMLLQDLKDYQDAELMKQKVGACFAVFVQDDNADTITGGTGGSNTRPLPEQIEPGTIEYLPPGKTITFASPPANSGYGEHTRRVLLAIAAGYPGLTYEALTGDMSNVNFSSGRMNWIEAHRQVENLQLNLMIAQVCDPLFNWFMDAIMLAGFVKKPCKAEWTAPRREMIDPVKEIAGMMAQVRAGFMSYQEALRTTGNDPDAVMREISEDYKKIDTLGLVLDSDPRKDLMSAPSFDGGKPLKEPGKRK